MDERSIDWETNEKVCKLDTQTLGTSMTPNKRPHFTIDWRQLTYYQRESSSLFNRTNVTKPKLILDHLDGCFMSGQLSAILGPSGAGKSTFLSALFGDKQESAFGETRVTWFEDCRHQSPVSNHVKQRPIRIAFLPQHDHLLNHLSVYETLMFASKIKNASRLSEMKPGDKCAFHKQNVKRVAKMLKITECLQTRCGRLSGGQYKRVSIGQELLSEPDVIILDEPTSGLDAMTCLTTVRTLKGIAMKHPISIILTIHQPDIDVFNLFDKIYVIAQGGRAIYEGQPDGVEEFLASANLRMPSKGYNPARFIVEQAFVVPPDASEININYTTSSSSSETTPPSGSDDDEQTNEHEDDEIYQETRENFEPDSAVKRSLLSLAEALKLSNSSLSGKKHNDLSLSTMGRARKSRESGRQLLLQIGGVKTADGTLIRSNKLQALDDDSNQSLSDKQKKLLEAYERQKGQRLELLKRLNDMQKAKYYPPPVAMSKNLDMVSSSESEDSQIRPNSVSSNKSDSSTKTTNDHFMVQLEQNANDESAPLKSVGNKSSGIGSFYAESQQSSSLRTNSRISTFSTNLSSTKQRRHFDKRLSAKHIQSKQRDQPTCYHSYLLTHRTWLSITRDPVFFGIQFCMHTSIPILLALIFGSQQDEGCPRVGQFDLVDFAYQADSSGLIKETMKSIRQSIGNIGVIFFEMFVLSFAINCITALVFPIDMYVLLKEYRNGWYSLRSYFIGRTLADLPVPIVLHSMAMCILCYMTGQPLEWWRFGSIIVIVIIASLVAQSVGLTIGALLMRSSQSAVLAAAGIVAPFFALSGFIVRIHTLPWVAQWAAQTSYLYHLLNGFIVLRYGFGRCPCEPQDFARNPDHQVPHNIRTMASIWVGTYSNEYEHAAQVQLSLNESRSRSNVDPNIDLVDKLTRAFQVANSYGHQVDSCNDVLPYALLDFNLRESDLWHCLVSLLVMLLVTRLVTFAAIYYKIRSFA